MERGKEACSARECKKRRVRRLAFPRAAFETLPAMSKKSLPRKPQEAG